MVMHTPGETDGLMLIIDKPYGLPVHAGPKGGETLADHLDALRFGLPRALESPRALAVPVRPNGWTHHVLIGRAEEIDGELMGWVAEARAFAER